MVLVFTDLWPLPSAFCLLTTGFYWLLPSAY